MLDVKDVKKQYYKNTKQKKAGLVIPVSGKLEFEVRNINR